MIRILACCAATLAAACAPRPSDAPLPKPAFVAPLSLDSLHIPFVRAALNGGEAAWWVVDSGAAPCVVDRGRAGDLGLLLRGRTQVRGAGAGTVGADSVVSRTVIRLEGVERFECEHLLALDLAGLATSLGRRVEGILGYDFFRRWVVELDYAGGRMRLYEPEGFRYEGAGRRIPIQLRGRRPYVTARIDPGDGGPPVERTLLVDTGSGDAVDDSVVLRSPAARSRVEGGVGLGTRYEAVLGRVASVEIGGYTLRDVPGVAPGVALIGGSALRRFRVILDYSRQEMILEPGPSFGEPFAGAGAARVTEISPDGLVATLPFEEHQFSLVFLRLATGGGNPAWFLVDTGTRGCVIGVRQESPSRRAADEKQLAVYFPGGGGLVCRPLAAADLAPLTDIIGHPVEGVLGSALFERYVVRIDYAARVIRLYEPSRFAYRGGGYAAPLSLHGGIPTIEAEIRDGPGRRFRRSFIVQTGSGDAVNDSAVIASSTMPRYRVPAGSLSSRDSILVGTLDTLRLGDVVLARLPSAAGPSTIGGAVLRRFTCIFDYRNRTLILEANRHVGDAFSRGLQQSSGMSLYASSHRPQPTVNEVTPAMPADRAGFARGDIILDVDGVAASRLGAQRLTEMFDRSGERYRVTVQRGASVISLVLVL